MNKIIQTINKPNKEGIMTTYNNVDLRDLPKGESITVKNLGEPMEIPGQWGKRYMFKMIIEGTEATTFVNTNMKAEGPGISFGTKVYEALTEKVGDIKITRTKQSIKAKIAGTDKFDLWKIEAASEEPTQVQATSAAVTGSLVLLPNEQTIVNSGLKGKPFEQIKELFDAYSIPEARAIRIYEEYLK